MPVSSRTAAIVLGIGLLAAAPASAQTLNLRHYTVADGLAQDSVGTIFQDSRGYLWFGTVEGLSRFDGYRFVTYGTADGLPHALIGQIGESREGHLWVAPFVGGLSTLHDDPPERGALSRGPRFITHPVAGTKSVDAFVFADDGALWSVGADGIYRAASGAAAAQPFSKVVPSVATGAAGQNDRAFKARDGSLWFSVNQEIVRIRGESVVRYPAASTMAVGFAQRADGTMLLAREDDVYAPARGEGAAGAWRALGLDIDAPISALAVDAADRLWVGTQHGVFRVEAGTAHASAVRGIDAKVGTIMPDRDRNVWVATFGAGVYKIPSDLIINFTRADGMPADTAFRVVEGRDGAMYAVTGDGIAELRSDGATTLKGFAGAPLNSIERRLVADRRGGWWAWTRDGLMHAPGPALRAGAFTRVSEAGHAEGPAVGPGLFEDAAGVMWIATASNKLLRFDPGAPAARAWTTVDLGAATDAVGRIVADRSGALWLSGYGTLLRLDAHRVSAIGPGPGLPETLVRSLYLDSRGWMWLGLRYGGVSMTRDPAAPTPVFENYGKAQGVASEAVWSIAEDLDGRMYFGTGKGLDRLDPRTGRLSHIAQSDGLAGSAINHCVRDSRGDVWIATGTGVSKLPYTRDTPAAALPPPPAYLTAIQVAGEPVDLPIRGAVVAPPLELTQARSTIRIEYVGLSFRGERALRYQYVLEGADRDWSAPTDERAVTYGGLAPGSYSFRVRAVTPDGAVGTGVAAMTVRVLPPVWRRWWFMSAATLAVALAGFSLHRFRLRQILATEAVRRQVSRDLHDDVGSGLVQIAVLSELARDDMVFGARSWPDVARLARSLRDSMSDIVWAVDPQKDTLSDLVQRMREVASTLLESDGRVVAFNGPDPRAIERTGMATDRRRHLLLFFKEAVTNVSRHARANRVSIDLRVSVKTLTLAIVDDGCGFEVATVRRGNGLTSLEARARQLGGELDIHSAPGHGTTVLLTVPS